MQHLNLGLLAPGAKYFYAIDLVDKRQGEFSARRFSLADENAIASLTKEIIAGYVNAGLFGIGKGELDINVSKEMAAKIKNNRIALKTKDEAVTKTPDLLLSIHEMDTETYDKIQAILQQLLETSDVKEKQSKTDAAVNALHPPSKRESPVTSKPSSSVNNQFTAETKSERREHKIQRENEVRETEERRNEEFDNRKKELKKEITKKEIHDQNIRRDDRQRKVQKDDREINSM